MEDFYREQRRRFGVLMDGAEPVGGRWNYDTENRESPPKGGTALDVAAPYRPREDDIDDEVRRDLDRMGLDTVGVDGPRLFAVTPAEARRALTRFIADRLPLFGRYEDAMMGGDWAMAHSLLSVPLNLGVLHPLDAVHAAERAYRDGAAPLAAVEGFIRQILGLAGVHVAAVLALRPGLSDQQRTRGAHPAAAVVGRPRCGRGRAPNACARRWPACATGAGCTTSSG